MCVTYDVWTISSDAVDVKVKIEDFRIIKERGKYRILFTINVSISDYCRHRIVRFKALFQNQ